MKISQRNPILLNLIKNFIGGTINLDKKGISRLKITSMKD